MNLNIPRLYYSLIWDLEELLLSCHFVLFSVVKTLNNLISFQLLWLGVKRNIVGKPYEWSSRYLSKNADYAQVSVDIGILPGWFVVALLYPRIQTSPKTTTKTLVLGATPPKTTTGTQERCLSPFFPSPDSYVSGYFTNKPMMAKGLIG